MPDPTHPIPTLPDPSQLYQAPHATPQAAILPTLLPITPGSYVGGGRSLQGANSIQFIAGRALCPSNVEDEHMIEGVHPPWHTKHT